MVPLKHNWTVSNAWLWMDSSKTLSRPVSRDARESLYCCCSGKTDGGVEASPLEGEATWIRA
jgi:hypothetical protein